LLLLLLLLHLSLEEGHLGRGSSVQDLTTTGATLGIGRGVTGADWRLQAAGHLDVRRTARLLL